MHESKWNKLTYEGDEKQHQQSYRRHRHASKDDFKQQQHIKREAATGRIRADAEAKQVSSEPSSTAGQTQSQVRGGVVSQLVYAWESLSDHVSDLSSSFSRLPESTRELVTDVAVRAKRSLSHGSVEEGGNRSKSKLPIVRKSSSPAASSSSVSASGDARSSSVTESTTSDPAPTRRRRSSADELRSSLLESHGHWTSNLGELDFGVVHSLMRQRARLERWMRQQQQRQLLVRSILVTLTTIVFAVCILLFLRHASPTQDQRGLSHPFPMMPSVQQYREVMAQEGAHQLMMDPDAYARLSGERIGQTAMGEKVA